MCGIRTKNRVFRASVDRKSCRDVGMYIFIYY